MNKKNNFSQNLKALLKAHNSNQSALADELHVNRSTISKWEEGRSFPSTDSLLRLADYYSISLDELITGNYYEAFQKTILENQKKLRMKAENKELFPVGDELLFPRISTLALDGIESFRQAQKIDLANPHPHDDAFHEMMCLYYDAFSTGILAAGINLLRHLSVLHVVLRGCVPSFDYPFQRHMEYILSVFNALNHPIAEYYEAVSLIYKCMNTEMDDDSASDSGLIYMSDLASEGNKYAAAFLDAINNQDEQSPHS